MAFALKLARCGAVAEKGATTGLRPEWAAVEHITHDMGHVVSLGIQLSDRVWLAEEVDNVMREFPRPLRRICEAETIAIQVLFFDRVGAFLDDDRGIWVQAVCSKQKVSREVVETIMGRPQTVRMAGVLHSRLRGLTRGVTLDLAETVHSE